MAERVYYLYFTSLEMIDNSQGLHEFLGTNPQTLITGHWGRKKDLQNKTGS
jgi:hypothetical protein